MKNTFTYSEIQQLQKEEQFLIDEIENADLEKPLENAVLNILAYSKALSVKPSESIEFIEILNN